MRAPVYRGDQPCVATMRNGKPCRNRASYICSQTYVCKRHAKDGATILPIKPASVRRQEKEAEQEYELTHATQSDQPRIVLVKLQMRRRLAIEPGYITVFPNYRNSQVLQTAAMSFLSPMKLGPVYHGMTAPVASCLENFYQFAKQFAGESIEEWQQAREIAYRDATPHRYKERAKPLFARYETKSGSYIVLSYIASRWVYCYWYERLVQESEKASHALAVLRQLYKDGYSLRIAGYDGREVAFTDPSSQFGHECVLKCLITGTRPWHEYYKRRRRYYDRLAWM